MVSIKIPVYSEKLIDPATEYLLNFDLLVRILLAPKVSSFWGTALFDGFSYSLDQSIRPDKLYLEFTKGTHDTLFFGSDTILSRDRFFPLFKTAQIENDEYHPAIADAFFLFSKIAKSGLINHPVLIDLKKDQILFVSKARLLTNKKILTQPICQNEIKSEPELDQLLDNVSLLPVNKIISLKYPYHTNLDSRIFSEFDSIRHFEICFRFRFSTTEIDENDVYLLTSELEGNNYVRIVESIQNYQVIATEHQQELYNDLIDLKLAWESLNLNAFRYPFPSKWFMCIHKGSPLEFWKDLYQKDFPAIKGILLQNVTKIIESIYEIDWFDKFVAPESEGIAVVKTSQMFPDAFDSFNNHIREKFNRVYVYEDRLPLTTFRDNKVIILDPFNKILLSNLSHLFDFCDIKILAPDFVYYTSPFIRYYTISYQYDALLKGARIWFDNHYQRNLGDWEVQRRSLVDQIISDYKQYKKKYAILPLREQKEKELETQNEPADDLTESEVIELMDEKEGRVAITHNAGSVIITTVDNNRFTLKPNSPVLLEEKGYVIQTRAALINKGSMFLPLSEISKIIQRSSLLEKLASMPSTARNWKNMLFERKKGQPKLFSVLKHYGLSIQQITFERDYISEKRIVNQNDLHLPRSKQDWKIVCEYLNIKEGSEAWRCHKCREDINSLKKAYREIIGYLNTNCNFGNNVDNTVLEKVADIFETVTGLVEDDDIEERLSTAKSIIRDITKELILQEVNDIKLVQDEQDTRKT